MMKSLLNKQNMKIIVQKGSNFGRLLGSAAKAYQMSGVFVLERELILAGCSSAAAAYRNEGRSCFQKRPDFGKLVR